VSLYSVNDIGNKIRLAMYAQSMGAAPSPLAESDATPKEKKTPGVRTTINRHFEVSVDGCSST